MDKKEEQKLLNIVAALMNTVNEIREGQQLMTDAFILLEQRMNVFEASQRPKSKIMVPQISDLAAIKAKQAN